MKAGGHMSEYCFMGDLWGNIFSWQKSVAFGKGGQFPLCIVPLGGPFFGPFRTLKLASG